MDTLANLGLGFSVALEPTNLLFCFIGVFVGTFIGVLPGLGPIAAIALLLPLTFKMAPATAIIMLAGIYYGAMYGGSTTSILVNIPGEAASVVTCLDGYQMARQGRAGPALGIAALGSFIAGTFGLVGLMFFAPVLGAAALRFGPPEYFALTFLGLTLISYLSRGSMLKALLMAIFGLLLGTIGTDPISGQERFTYGSLTLGDGLGLVPVAMGVFGIAEVLENLWERTCAEMYMRRPSRDCCPAERTGRRASGPLSEDPSSVFSSASFPDRAAPCPPSPPMRWKSVSRAIPKNSAPALSRESPDRNQPTTPPPPAPLSRSSRSDSRLTSSWLSSWERS